jgi:hypothetical protein
MRDLQRNTGKTDPTPVRTVDKDGPPGLLKVVGIGAVVVALAFGAVRLMTHHNHTTLVTGPVLGSQAPSTPQALPTRTWALAHLGANTVQKCAAFRKILVQTQHMQAADGGTISAADATHLQKALSEAKAMTPESVTPPQCGVPL